LTSTSLRSQLLPLSAVAPVTVTDPASRASGIVGLVGVAAIHLAQIVPTTQETPYLGVGFVVLTVSSVALAACLLSREREVIWSAIAVVNAMAIIGYVFTRTFSTGFDNQDAGNWGEPLGLVALLVEGLLVCLGLTRMYRIRFAGVATGLGATPRQVSGPGEAEFR
jgi:hypothetical protein